MAQRFSTEKKREWKEKILDQQKSNQSILQWCRKNQVPYHSFLYWKNRLFSDLSFSRASFKELSSETKESGIAIQCKGMQILLSKNFDPITLKQSLRILKEALC